MASPSCPEIALIAIVAVASVSVLHTVLRPWIPDIRPLNCSVCLSLWIAIGVACKLWSLEALLAIPVTGFFAVVAAGLWPWAFYSKPA
jgi:hypothetical protein